MRFQIPAIAVRLAILCIASFGLISNVAAEDADSKPTKVSVFDKGEMTVPAEFKPTQPKLRMIEHEFKVGQGDQTARLTMMRAGGGVEPNIKRWKGQFSGGKDEDQKTEKLQSGSWEIHVADVSGSYAERVGGGPFFGGGKTVQRKDYAMIGAILVEPGDSPNKKLYFAKMIGPQELIKSHREKFIEMVKSVGK